MEYAAAIEAFFRPAPALTPIEAVAKGSPARQLRDAGEPIAMHAVWSPHTNAQIATLGLNFLTGYVYGRAAALGEPPAAVVAATFAAFSTALVTSLYDEGRAQVKREKLLSVRDQATIESLTQVLAGEDVNAAVIILRRGLATADPTGRPLFAGLSTREWPTAPVGQLWRACDLVREHRGDSHIAAYISAGLNPVEMNILTELYLGMPLGTYSATRAWDEAATNQAMARLAQKLLVVDSKLTENGHKLRQEIETRTDAMEQSIVEAIGSDLPTLLAQLNAWSNKCIAAGAFPPDDYKRAAG